MVRNILKWLKIRYKKTVTSIAFVPAIIALLFLLLSFAMIQFDFSETGKAFKSNWGWLRLKDATTARSITSAITAGIISLTVFSFSMVMILLNQAASQMSNRILDKLIGNRFQQVVLGFYIGTIVYALFLLSTIRDINSGIYVPAISTYLLIALTIVDIFLFIYFLHYITQSVKYETIIHRIYEHTKASLKKTCTLKEAPLALPEMGGKELTTSRSGIYQGFDKENLLKLCVKEDIAVSFLHPAGTFLLEKNPVLKITSKKELPADIEEKLSVLINIHRGEDINTNYYYGFKQLMEVAIKALSPGINDPDTAVISLQALADLLANRLQHHPERYIRDEDATVRIVTKEKSFVEAFESFILPIWDYGKGDRLVQREMRHILNQLQTHRPEPVLEALLRSI